MNNTPVNFGSGFNTTPYNVWEDQDLALAIERSMQPDTGFFTPQSDQSICERLPILYKAIAEHFHPSTAVAFEQKINEQPYVDTEVVVEQIQRLIASWAAEVNLVDMEVAKKLFSIISPHEFAADTTQEDDPELLEALKLSMQKDDEIPPPPVNTTSTTTTCTTITTTSVSQPKQAISEKRLNALYQAIAQHFAPSTAEIFKQKVNSLLSPTPDKILNGINNLTSTWTKEVKPISQEVTKKLYDIIFSEEYNYTEKSRQPQQSHIFTIKTSRFLTEKQLERVYTFLFEQFNEYAALGVRTELEEKDNVTTEDVLTAIKTFISVLQDRQCFSNDQTQDLLNAIELLCNQG